VVDAAGGGVTAGAGAILGSAGKLGETVGVAAGDGTGCVLVPVAKMLASCWSAATWPSLAGESGEVGDGCWRAGMRSRAAAIDYSRCSYTNEKN
jgi:hypothetical protein